MIKLYIPVGSEVFQDDVKIATIVKQINEGDRPMPDNFNPPLPIGFQIYPCTVYFDGIVIYEHPYFNDEHPLFKTK